MPSVSSKDSPFLTPVIWTSLTPTESKWSVACNQFATLAEFFISRSDKVINIAYIEPKRKVYIADPVAQSPLLLDFMMKPSLGCIRVSATGLRFMSGFLALRTLASLVILLQREQAHFLFKALKLPTSGTSVWFTKCFALMIGVLTVTKIYMRSTHSFDKLREVPDYTILNAQIFTEETD